jgi:hypothetical protein
MTARVPAAARPAAIAVSAAEVAAWMERLFVAVPEATLRQEDRRKAIEVAAMLTEIARAVTGMGRRNPLVLVDAASGKGYVGLLAAKLVLEPAGRLDARVITIEREPLRAQPHRSLLSVLATPVSIEARVGDVHDAALWPAAPALVVALHACGPAADAVIDQAVIAGAGSLLLVPCCTGRLVSTWPAAGLAAERLGFPRHSAVRGRFLQAFVDAERTWRLEAAGWQTEVVALCPPTVTPHNLLWRARKVGEPGRMAEARRERARLLSDGATAGSTPGDR